MLCLDSCVGMYVELTMNARIEEMCQEWEAFWRLSADAPHYKWLIRPVYKLLGGNRYPLFSVPATFLASDILFHALPSIILAMINEEEIHPYFHLMCSMLWVSLSIPIALHKYNKNKANEMSEDNKQSVVFAR